MTNEKISTNRLVILGKVSHRNANLYLRHTGIFSKIPYLLGILSDLYKQDVPQQKSCMKYCFWIATAIMFSTCTQQAGNTRALQNQIDSLQSKLSNSYKPGLGEFMSSIQVHHDKLWFAGKEQNWELADFEINEIKEIVDDIKKFCPDRPEVSDLGMIEPPLQSVSKAIEQKNSDGFKNSYLVLTATCNTCHQATKHGFNVITVPTVPPFSDQDFRPKK